jgi:excisionase family DNA binding protein
MADKKRRKEEMPELMSPHQAAEALGISLSGVLHAVRRGRLGVMRFGEVKLIPRLALEQYLKTKSKGGWPKGRPRKKA